MTEIMQRLAHLLYTQLHTDSPVLTGNMKNHIRIADVSDNKVTYVIDPPFYVIKKGKAVFTNVGYYKGKMRKLKGKKYGVISYANWVNEKGGFGTHNKSMHWVNRACYSACEKTGAVINNELEL